MSATSDRLDKPEQPLPFAPTRILVADDNHDMADSLCDLLRLLGYEAQAAYDGLEALQKVESFCPDVVVLDIAMPGLNGYDVARHLRAVPALQDALLVAVTGYGQMLDRVMSVLAGIDHHLVKPLNTEALVKLIKAHLARRSERAPGQDVLQ
jgi:two-component system, chemotaxis family, CheB/CheR fusion protein